MKLDLTKIEGLCPGAEKSTGRCPACAENGGDRKGKHLVIYPDGRFGCGAHQSDEEHRRRIFALVGLKGGKRGKPASMPTSNTGTFLGRELSFSRPYYPKLDSTGKAPVKFSRLCPLLGKAAVTKGEGG
jgi:hypothetical protein